MVDEKITFGICRAGNRAHTATPSRLRSSASLVAEASIHRVMAMSYAHGRYISLFRQDSDDALVQERSHDRLSQELVCDNMLLVIAAYPATLLPGTSSVATCSNSSPQLVDPFLHGPPLIVT